MDFPSDTAAGRGDRDHMIVMNRGIGFGDLRVIVALGLFVVSLVLAGAIGGTYEKRLLAHREVRDVMSWWGLT